MKSGQIAGFLWVSDAVDQNLIRIVLVETGEMIRIKHSVCLNYYGRLIGNG